MPTLVTIARVGLGLALVLAMSVPLAAQAPDGFVVIAHASNPVVTLKKSDVSKLFLRKRTRWPFDHSAEPMDQVESSAVRRRFSDAMLGMDVPSVKSFWQEIVFSGKGAPPPERATDADVIAFVKAHPNAIAYVASVTALDGVKVIIVTP